MYMYTELFPKSELMNILSLSQDQFLVKTNSCLGVPLLLVLLTVELFGI